MKFWDIRVPNEPVLSRMEHSHWVWNIRINRFHDQLVLTSSSDSRVILYSIVSISSEPYGHIVSPEDDNGQGDEMCRKDKYVILSNIANLYTMTYGIIVSSNKYILD